VRMAQPPTILFDNEGYCSVCRGRTTFVAEGEWLRDQYICSRCRSIPRQRALIEVLDQVAPRWPELRIHESSPSMSFFANHCRGYSYSFFFEDIAPGEQKNGLRCENLEQLTFADCGFDVFITQDVMEHVFDPQRALTEIMRVLDHGGLHIFTTPKHRALIESCRRAELVDGIVNHIREPEYHASPIGDGRALVTWDYGADFEHLVARWSGYLTSTYVLRDRRHGIDGEYLEVFVTVKERINLVRPSA
jgi:SAM-dependent methyltransferase